MKSEKVAKPKAKTKTAKIKAKLLGAYYGHPIKDMKLICVTGTAGKVEVANYVHEILKAAGQPCAILASDGAIKMGALHKFLSTSWKAGANYVIVTAPAESLEKDIFAGLPVHVAALTNFVPSSLDAPSAEEFAAAESTLFDMEPDFVILNRDDAHFQDFAEFTGKDGTISYGMDRYSDVQILSSKLYKKGAEARISVKNMPFTVATFLTGEPVVHYMAAAVAIADALNITQENIADGIANYAMEEEAAE